MSEHRDQAVTGAVELASTMDRALSEFQAEYSPLVRRACLVPDSLEDLTPVVLYSFLGHTLERVLRARGRQATETLLRTLLDQLTAAHGFEPRPSERASH